MYSRTTLGTQVTWSEPGLCLSNVLCGSLTCVHNHLPVVVSVPLFSHPKFGVSVHLIRPLPKVRRPGRSGFTGYPCSHYPSSPPLRISVTPSDLGFYLPCFSLRFLTVSQTKDTNLKRIFRRGLCISTTTRGSCAVHSLPSVPVLVGSVFLCPPVPRLGSTGFSFVWDI